MSHKIGDYRGPERAADFERDRLEWLARGLDANTCHWFDEIGIRPGWRCLEIGAATGSISCWLADRVGAQGRVVAADLDTRFLQALDRDNIEVRELDLRTGALEAESFDLAFCRTVLLHLPDPGGAVAKLAASLARGGVLVAEEPDMMIQAAADPDAPDADAFESYFRELYARLRARKRFDTKFGRRLPRLFASAGLAGVEVRMTAKLERGGSPAAVSLTQTVDLLDPPGGPRAEQSERVKAQLADPAFEYVSGVQVTAWGTRA